MFTDAYSELFVLINLEYYNVLVAMAISLL